MVESQKSTTWRCHIRHKTAIFHKLAMEVVKKSTTAICLGWCLTTLARDKV
jgi:hypothetical protein